MMGSQTPAEQAHVWLQIAGGRGGAAAATAAPEDEGEPTEGNAGGAAVAGAAKKRLLAAMMKKFLGEEMLPVLLELRTVLAAARCALAKDLGLTLMALLKEHKHEVKFVVGFVVLPCSGSWL